MLLAFMRDLIKQLRVSADSRSLGRMCRSSCRSAEFVYCFHTGSAETAQGQAVRKDAGLPDPGAGEVGVLELPAPCRCQAKENTVWLPTNGEKLGSQLPDFQSQYLLVSSALFPQLSGNVVALKNQWL